MGSNSRALAVLCLMAVIFEVSMADRSSQKKILSSPALTLMKDFEERGLGISRKVGWAAHEDIIEDFTEVCDVFVQMTKSKPAAMHMAQFQCDTKLDLLKNTMDRTSWINVLADFFAFVGDSAQCEETDSVYVGSVPETEAESTPPDEVVHDVADIASGDVGKEIEDKAKAVAEREASAHDKTGGTHPNGGADNLGHDVPGDLVTERVPGDDGHEHSETATTGDHKETMVPVEDDKGADQAGNSDGSGAEVPIEGIKDIPKPDKRLDVIHEEPMATPDKREETLPTPDSKLVAKKGVRSHVDKFLRDFDKAKTKGLIRVAFDDNLKALEDPRSEEVCGYLEKTNMLRLADEEEGKNSFTRDECVGAMLFLTRLFIGHRFFGKEEPPPFVWHWEGTQTIKSSNGEQTTREKKIPVYYSELMSIMERGKKYAGHYRWWPASALCVRNLCKQENKAMETDLPILKCLNVYNDKIRPKYNRCMQNHCGFASTDDVHAKRRDADGQENDKRPKRRKEGTKDKHNLPSKVDGEGRVSKDLWAPPKLPDPLDEANIEKIRKEFDPGFRLVAGNMVKSDFVGGKLERKIQPRILFQDEAGSEDASSSDDDLDWLDGSFSDDERSDDGKLSDDEDLSWLDDDDELDESSQNKGGISGLGDMREHSKGGIKDAKPGVRQGVHQKIAIEKSADGSGDVSQESAEQILEGAGITQ